MTSGVPHSHRLLCEPASSGPLARVSHLSVCPSGSLRSGCCPLPLDSRVASQVWPPGVLLPWVWTAVLSLTPRSWLRAGCSSHLEWAGAPTAPSLLAGLTPTLPRPWATAPEAKEPGSSAASLGGWTGDGPQTPLAELARQDGLGLQARLGQGDGGGVGWGGRCCGGWWAAVRERAWGAGTLTSGHRG